MTSDSIPAAPETASLLETYVQKRADLVRFFTIRLGAPAEAEDLVQEIYLKIVNGPAPQDLQSPAAYLYRIGSNLLIDRHRGRIRSKKRERDWYGVYRTISGGQEIADAPNADDALDAKQRLAAVMAAVEDLPPQCQNVFRLHKFEGLTHAEVSERLGISKSAVEKHVSAALKALARRLS